MVSNDPDFETKAADVIGLYLNPRLTPSCSASMRRPRSRRWIFLAAPGREVVIAHSARRDHPGHLHFGGAPQQKVDALYPRAHQKSKAHPVEIRRPVAADSAGANLLTRWTSRLSSALQSRGSLHPTGDLVVGMSNSSLSLRKCPQNRKNSDSKLTMGAIGRYVVSAPWPLSSAARATRSMMVCSPQSHTHSTAPPACGLPSPTPPAGDKTRRLRRLGLGHRWTPSSKRGGVCEKRATSGSHLFCRRPIFRPSLSDLPAAPGS